MRRWILVGLALLAVLVQVTVLPAWRPLGIVPNLLLVVIAIVGLEGTASLALGVAVLSGVLLDLASGADFGLWTGVLVIVALVMGLIHRAGIELSGILVASVVVAGATCLMALALWLGITSRVQDWPWGWMMTRLGLELVCNLLLVACLRPMLRWILPKGGEV